MNFDDPYGMWFLDPLVRDIINLSLLSKKNIRLCSNMQLILASLYKSVDSEYAYFIGFENDDLLYFYPAKEYKEFKTLIVNISDDCKGKGVIRASCIGSYIEVKKKYGEYLKDPNSDKNPYVLIYFSLPQLYNTNVMITPLCIAFGGMDPELKAIMCIIFYLKQVSDYLSLNSVNKTKSPLLQKPNYFYIVYPDTSSLVISIFSFI